MILALDASTARASVALAADQRIIQEVFVDAPRGRGGMLFSALEAVVRNTTEIESIVVGVGPGSYNGIRSAIAVAWGIAMARQIPLFGISSLLGLGEGSYCAIGDARREQFYFARVENGRLQAEPALLTKDELAAAVKQLPALPLFAPAAIDFLSGVIIRSPSAAILARRANGLNPGLPEPVYLKPAHITTLKEAPNR
jgi:tRNA threonylcarbamoyladenosine biosynthesis protein TsaB